MAWLKSILGLKPAFRASNRLAQSAVRQLGTHPPPVFEIRSSPGKGLGVFATKDIPRDAVVMRDPLVFRFTEGEDLVQRYRRFTMLPNTTQENILGLAVRQKVELAVKLKKYFGDEPCRESFAIMHLENVIDTNALCLTTEALFPAGLFLNAARINHSCIANTDQASADDVGFKVMRANRDIYVGEEITFSYIINAECREARQRKLSKEGWDFACQCPACDPGHPFYDSHEERLQTLYSLYQEDYEAEDGRLRSAGMWSYKVLEKAANRARRRIELITGHGALRRFAHQMYLAAFDIALARYKLTGVWSDLEDAVKLLDLVIREARFYYGETDAITRKHKELYERLRKGDI